MSNLIEVSGKQNVEKEAGMDLIRNLQFSDIDQHIENVFGSLNVQQKASLKRLYKAVLFIGKKVLKSQE
jgi:hypothetical protein